MKSPNMTVYRIINKEKYLIKLYYTYDNSFLLLQENNYYVLQGSIIKLCSKECWRFVDETILKITQKINIDNQYFLGVDNNKKTFYYLGKKVNFKIRENLIIFDDEKFESIKISKKITPLLAETYVNDQLNKKLIIVFKFYADEAYKKIVGEECNLKFIVMKKNTSWASINIRTHRISICNKLIHFSEEIIRYVAYHEICHIIHPNHSKAFRDLLESFIPNFRELDKKQKRHILV
ncbi:YgjP-like metallopeptidase domain-containing protein [Mycoplasma sp. 125]|uniref:YgjP-like metallopeptidase domain-containing protein n=1 Tax=Mycoplasma sp. 125 TaxID=3447505 RepID=UPI003F65F31F